MAANKTADVRYAPEDPSLPKPWKALIDVKTNYKYFWNPQTNITQYQKPDTSNVKPQSLDKCVSVAICSPVQVQQSSQIPNQEIPTINDDNNRNSRGGEYRPNVDSGERSDQNATGWMFREGTAVEVAFQQENFDIWHVGTVVKATVNNKCLVKYQCPGDVNQQKIQEFANSPDIRPSPPSLEENDYFLLEKVEAFFEFCWWSGTIRRLLEDRRYIVKIKHANKEMTFDHADLRPCMVWTDGKWITEAKYNKRPGVLTRQSENSNGQQRRAEEQQAGNGCVSAEKEDGTGVHVKEIVDKECSTKEVDMSLKNVKGGRSTKYCDISQKEDQAKQSRDQEIHSVDRIKGSTKGSNSSKRKRGRPNMFKKQIGERSTGAKMNMKDICVGDEGKLSAENDCVMSTTADEIPNNGDFHASSKENMAVNTSDRKLRSGVRRHNAVISRIANIPLLDDQAGETDSSKRVNRLKNSMSNGHGETSRIVDSESRYQGCHEFDIVKDDNMMIDEVGDINDDQPLSMWLNVLPPVGSDDSRALPVQDQCVNNAKGGHDGFKTPPLAKVATIKPSPLQKTDCPSPGDLPIKNLNGCAESNDKGCELGTPAIVSINAMENESLPFVKCSPLWKNIDSMKIYKTTKKPHFSPLVKCIEETREGLAIGIIVNFSNLVENTSKLQFSSDIAIIARSLEILPEFESHGFDVEKVRACLTQLLSNKQRANELQKEYDNIGSEISNGLDEGEHDTEINQLYQKFREIEKKLAEAKLKKEMREKTISALQSKRDVVGKTVQSLQVEFESIVGSLYDK